MIRSILKQQKISLNKFQKIAVKLQYEYFGITGGQGLFSTIKQAMAGITPFITLKPSIKKFPSDWCSIITQISTQPTSVTQLVLELPSYAGYSGACKLGEGRV